ncbi:hypothetical protein ATW55_14935 [Ferroacidibacillus organovorans]|uniref:Uncharacterized protein n=1 Tax=Ferroacidibacillus organovorans TaxID=1765683 RepID=A0A101XQR0_9BACL|nr:hypothetical protein ATW55_14935 [Ferroacidibacillus organovorans]
MYGVEQVNRRTKIVQRDWDKIKKCSDIDLPDSPPAEQNILKIVCLNIFGFTAFERNGVLITDYSALLRFFSGPMVNRIIGNRNSVQIEPGLRLWSGGKPSVADFVDTYMNLQRFGASCAIWNSILYLDLEFKKMIITSSSLITI